jgi:hypothetical protein
MSKHRKGGELRFLNKEVLGRLYWDPTHPSPWAVFRNETEYNKWATAVRKVRPGTKTERCLNTGWWDPARLLRSAESKAKSEMSAQTRAERKAVRA